MPGRKKKKGTMQEREMNLTYAQAGRQLGVSRQAVHEAVKRGRLALPLTFESLAAYRQSRYKHYHLKGPRGSVERGVQLVKSGVSLKQAAAEVGLLPATLGYHTRKAGYRAHVAGATSAAILDVLPRLGKGLTPREVSSQLPNITLTCIRTTLRSLERRGLVRSVMLNDVLAYCRVGSAVSEYTVTPGRASSAVERQRPVASGRSRGAPHD